jgi:hypothetical protein
MVGGKREKDEFTLFKEDSRSIKGRPVAVKDKSLNIKGQRVENQLSQERTAEHRMTKAEGKNSNN